MTLEELDLFLNEIPGEERARLIAMGKQFGSADTLAQADKTLNAYDTEGYPALLAEHGFSLEDGARLRVIREALELAGGRRSSAQTDKKTTSAAYDLALQEGKKIRKRGLAILEGALSALRKKSGQEAREAAEAIVAVLGKTSSVGADARSLAEQLELLLGVLRDNAVVAAAAAMKGGPRAALDLDARARALREVAPTAEAPRGTPVDTERMNLLDALIIELARAARKAARSAADEIGQPSLADAFELDRLYRANNLSKEEAQARARRREKMELIVKTLSMRGLLVSEEALAKIRAAREDAPLDRWLSLAGSVAAVEALFN